MNVKANAGARISAKLDRVPASEVTKPPTTVAKKGIEVVREQFQAHADAKPVARVVVHDHDENQVLFSGSEAQYDKLLKSGKPKR